MTKKNIQLQLAEEFVNSTGCHIFLTGKAGTGKTTFLHNVIKKTNKRVVVTAPTGVAAINAGGVTLHSFFQLPFGPFVPGSDVFNQQNQHRVSKEKRNILKSLDLLVIDEISMVRADLLDLIDLVLRRYRSFDLPFGGVQLLMIGDLHQLPPVVKESEWQLLKKHYETPYFFSSTALKQTELVPIELLHIYRQNDDSFIELLNGVRDNSLSKSQLDQLNSRYIPDFKPPKEQTGYITLCTHNSNADTINRSHLDKLQGVPRFFAADLEGDFPQHAYPTAASLELKIGAQVMFVRNDPAPDKLYFNGKIGTITKMSELQIEVSCPDDPEPIVVERSKWENIEYSVDPETSEISQNTIGTFSQYPLKLAWAITIHKSQGLTFDHAMIDAQAAFAHGQVYVALSRCRTLEGMVLSGPLRLSAIKTDHAVNNFVRQARLHSPDEARLLKAKRSYQQQLIMDCFSMQKLGKNLSRLVTTLKQHEQVLNLPGGLNMAQLEQQTAREICEVGENFRRQLYSLFTANKLPEDDDVIQERLQKASAYFQDKFDSLLLPFLSSLHFETDNKELRKRINNGIKWLDEEVTVKHAAIRSLEQRFTSAGLLRAISVAEIVASKPRPKAATPEYSEADVGHPELFDQLKSWRKMKATEKGLQLYQVMHQKTLVQIAVHLPDSLIALKKIKGIGEKLAENYGSELVELVASYRQENGITTVKLPDSPLLQLARQDDTVSSASKKTDTKEITLQHFQQGKNADQIANERGLTTSTVENHIAHLVEKGKISVHALVCDSDLESIAKTAKDMNGAPLRAIREAAGSQFTYAEVKYVCAHLRNAEAKQAKQAKQEA